MFDCVFLSGGRNVAVCGHSHADMEFTLIFHFPADFKIFSEDFLSTLGCVLLID